MNIGANIKKYRLAKNLTQKQLADKAGVAEITIRQYESEKRQPKIEIIQKIAVALDISEGRLLEWDDPDLSTAMLEIIERDLLGKPYLSENELNYYTEKIRNKLTEASNIEDILERDNFSYDEAIKICSELVNHLCEATFAKRSFSSTDILDLADLVGYFISFNFEAKRTVLDLERNLFEIVHPKPEPDWIKSIRAKHSPKKD